MPLYGTFFEQQVEELDTSSIESILENRTVQQQQAVEGEEQTVFSMPSYMRSADSYNIINKNETFAESIASTAQAIPKFIVTSLISGANQLYNAPRSIAKLAGADVELSDTADVIKAIDEDLYKFYEEHKEGSDLVGFIASSMIPGLAGIKVLNAGQASLRGAINANKMSPAMAKSLGLLAPEKDKWLSKAVSEVINSNAAPMLTNRNTVRAIAAGAGQNIYEAAAFEVAVAATLFDSPILENQDFGDLLTNIAWGGVVFGGIGGIATGVKSAYTVKKAKKAANVATNPWKGVDEFTDSTPIHERIALDIEQLHNIPPVPAKGIELGDNLITAETLTKEAAKKAETLTLRIRTHLSELAGKDEVAAGAMMDLTRHLDETQKLQVFIGANSLTRFADVSKVEARRVHLAEKIKSKKASAVEIDEAIDLNTVYHRVWGTEAKNVYDEAPTPTFITDYLRKNQKIELSGNTVKAADLSFKFDRVYGKDKYNILKATPYETQARYYWAMKSPALAKPSKVKPFVVASNDLPLLEKVVRDIDPADIAHVHVAYENGVTATINNMDNLTSHIQKKKLELINKLHDETLAGNIKSDAFASETKLKRMLGLDSNKQVADYDKTLVGKYTERANQLSQEEIASIVNVRPSMMDGLLRKGDLEWDDLYAIQSYSKEYSKHLRDTGQLSKVADDVDIWNVPQHLKLTYNTKGLENMDNHVLENMAIIKSNQRIYVDGLNRAVASNLGADDYNRLVEVTSKDVKNSSNSLGAGPRFVTSANANYDTLASKTEYLGNTVTGMRTRMQDATREIMEPALHNIVTKPAAAIEFATINNRLASIPEQYVINAEGNALELAVIARWKAKAAQITAANEAKAAARAAKGKAPTKPKPIPAKPTVATPDAPELIPIQHEDTLKLAKLHIERNGMRVEGHRRLNTAKGVMDTRDPEVFHPIPVNPKDYPFFGLVVDNSITGTGHKKMIYANTQRELDAMIDKLNRNPHLKVRTKAETEAYFRSEGKYEFEKTLNQNYLDHTLKREGVGASYFVPTDPQKIADDFLNWHLTRDAGYINENVLAKYEVPFKELQRLGDNYTELATSKFSNLSQYRHADEVVENPYGQYIRTALGLKNYADYPWWTSTNRLVDDAVSKMYKRIDTVWHGAKNTDELKEINNILRESGYKGAAYDEGMELFANASAPSGVLSAAVQKANSILAAITLRLDPLNALNNAVSANVLLGAETRHVLKAIEQGDSELVGRLTQLAKIKVPGTDKYILSPTKLIANSVKKFGRDTPEMAFYKKHRFVTSISDQYKWTLDNMTFNGKESIKAWDDRLGKVHSQLRGWVEKGEGLTQNKLAEEFNRFVAADVMKQITDLAVAQKIISPREQLTFINTFVNRTQANYLASQRPMLFQGPIGQAVGLFQTYQFNLMQQLLRYVGEGTAKDAMTLLALQGTIHGMNGLPGFHAINEHIVGNASGNVNHRDFYDTTYGVLGQEAGDWLTYGIASNAAGLLHPDLKINLYTRGDINPRHVTIIPSSPADIPIIGATAKVFGNLVETSKKLQAGGDVATTLLQGLEHNGVSRPLAGLAQTLEAMANPLGQSYSTTNKGNVIASNDFLSLANVGRMLGGKPMDEAITIDAYYRFQAYRAKDNKKKQLLGEALKTKIIAGQEITSEEVDDFAEAFAKAGGRQEQFTEWFTQLYKSANTSQANMIRDKLDTPYGQSMQRIMGGAELRDFQ